MYAPTHSDPLARTSQEALYREIGQRIRKERKALGFNQTELASFIGYERPTSISEIEKGQHAIAVHVLYSIAEALGISLFCLLPDNKPEE